MILVDTGVWIDHLHASQPELVELLESDLVLTHGLVIGELSLGSIRGRDEVLGLLDGLDRAAEASHAEVSSLVESAQLWGRGLGIVDAHLLASARLMSGARLWTRDRRLAEAATSLGVG